MGREALFAGKFDYVKYTDQYKSRAHIDFSGGRIMVETVSGLDPRAHLRRAIIETLLTPDDPAEVDLYSDREIMPGASPSSMARCWTTRAADPLQLARGALCRLPARHGDEEAHLGSATSSSSTSPWWRTTRTGGVTSTPASSVTPPASMGSPRA